jgi:hypothetical protein
MKTNLRLGTIPPRQQNRSTSINGHPRSDLSSVTKYVPPDYGVSDAAMFALGTNRDPLSRLRLRSPMDRPPSTYFDKSTPVGEFLPLSPMAQDTAIRLNMKASTRNTAHFGDAVQAALRMGDPSSCTTCRDSTSSSVFSPATLGTARERLHPGHPPSPSVIPRTWRANPSWR